MRPVLLDTNAYSAIKREDKAIVEILQYAEVVGMSPIVLGEKCYQAL
jgi:predicted nucleic acid-binding protein